ncbi:tyrosine-type recombinase/integrase, partial [Butyrivibrio sp.]|uniref:tyrosine-type recombinase/integrase n=1 Tax=Butyrivibrio sp. TaxID=28121 RepID=UPI0025BA6A14
YEYHKILGFCEEEIDGYTGFVFITSQHTVILPEAVNRAIHCIVNKHNEEETLKAKEEGRKPILLPDFTAHVLRHTFCTRLCVNESNTLFIKDVMGHADINTTMNIYADITNEKKKEVMSGLQGKII